MVSSFVAGDRGVISVGSGNDWFNVYVPKGCTPENAAAILASVSPFNGVFKRVPGEVMADIVAAIHPKTRCRMVLRDQLAANLAQSDYRFIIDLASTKPVRVYETDTDDDMYPIFQGSVMQLAAWAKQQTGLERLVKKVVEFKYNGGSKVGSKRLIHVEKIVKKADSVSIEGIDMLNPDFDPFDANKTREKCYRQYTTDKIEGDIEVRS